MTVRLLIDGYNLLYATGALGVVGGRGGPKELMQARQRLLSQLAKNLTEEQRRATEIVFDSRRGDSDKADAGHSVHSMTVTFSIGYESADELLEHLIRHHSNPRRLTVVSSDQRIQRAARARKALAIDCDQWLMQFVDGPSRLSPAPGATVDQTDDETDDPIDGLPEKFDPRHPPSSEEVHRWLDEFGMR